MLIMGTRAAAFTAKVRSLNDFQLRLTHGIQPPPSGVDIANTLKYFTQTLLTVLKDVPNSPLEMLKCREQDSARMGLFPSLEYKGLYRAATTLLEVATLIQYGLHPFGVAILQCLGCLLPFLEPEMIDTLPYLVASALAVFPPYLHQEVINSLCFHILPFTITRRNEEEESYASQSTTAVVMLVFQHSTSVSHHCQLLERLMALKPNVVKDVLCVIAYGTSPARASAARLLFYYWPSFNPTICDFKAVQLKVTNDWNPFVCQRDSCPNAGNAEAAKVCYDHCISITFAKSDHPPPLYLCIECANTIHREHPDQIFYDILHPMNPVSQSCENKNCRAGEKHAVSVCFTSECASYNGNHPIRFCKHCHDNRHNNRRGGDHIVHRSLTPVWDMDAEMQTYLLESVVSLLKEAKPGTNNPNKDNADTQVKNTLLSVLNVPPPSDNMTLEESQLLGRYGVWLLIGLCTPKEDTPPEVLGRLLSILFHWFYVTAYLYDDQVLSEGTIEKLKNEHICGWLNSISKSHFKVFVSCLLPHPPEYARVGGHWDTLSSRTCHLKEGIHRLLCLVPYEVVSSEIWEHIMPRWLEAIVQDVPPRELFELKLLLSKILDPVLSPLGFEAKKMYRFVSVRFKKTTSSVQEQALSWLQVLTTLEIIVPLQLLFSMFNDGIKVMQPCVKSRDKSSNHLVAEEDTRRSSILSFMEAPVKEDDCDNGSPLSDDEVPSSKAEEFATDTELDLSCSILMLDILIKQMELQNTDRYCGITTSLGQDVWQLLRSMLSANWSTAHHCDRRGRECGHCEARVMWFQLALELVTFINPEVTAHPPDTFVEETSEEGLSRKSPPDSEKKQDPRSESVINMPLPLLEVHSVGGVLVHMPHIMTATVETVAEQLDLAPVVAAERILPAVARQVTISDTDVATATAKVAQATLVGENDQLIEGPEEDSENFWHTSEGKFRFVIDELPGHLQLLYTLLSSLPRHSVSELYHALQCVHVLVLHGDAFTKASKDHRGFFIWCQENLLIKSLWELCSASQSHVCEVAVPLLLHCITLPCGSDTFWKVVQQDFHNIDWKVRFEAVERVTVTARFMDQTPLINEPVLQAALANVFCYLISSMDDENVQVAQRATLYLGTIHDSALRALIGCLETQFDTVIVDRPVVLQVLYQLHNCLSDRKILTWEFFLSRFDALFLEAQISLEKAGDLSFVRDLRNSDLSSESYVRKLNRAQEALSRSESSNDGSIKTLSASFGPKWPYKRTMSAPASMIPQPETKPDREKVYNRQYSAPMLKRKSSRMGLGQFLGSVAPGSTLPDGHIHQLVAGDDSGLAGLVRALNLEGNDHETIHLLVFLLMQFLSRQDQAFPAEEKMTARTHGIVLRHLFNMLGYSQQENTFYFPPQRLRTSPAFNAFLANLPQVLDQNHLMGWLVASPGMAVLLHCPASRNINQAISTSMPNYTIWLLESHARRCWLMAVLVLLYKYNYNQQPQCLQVTSLVRIVLNTLCAHQHVCRRLPASVIVGSAPTRSREVSQPSLGGEKDESEKQDTPPLSPICVDGKGKLFQKSPGGVMETHWEEPDGRHRFSMDEGENELASFPDNTWKSDSTLRGTPQDVEEPGERKMSLHEKVKTSWFLGGDDDSSKQDDSKKCGVKQGVMMMVASSLFASTQPVAAKPGNLYNGSAQSKPVLPGGCERRSSLACAVATAMQPVVATATVVSVPNKTTASGATKTSIVTTVPPLTIINPGEKDKQKDSSRPIMSTTEKLEKSNSNHSVRSTTSPCLPPHLSRPVTAPWRIDSAMSCSSEGKYSTDLPYVRGGAGGANDYDYHSYGSPESPLSKMDLITMGSPVDIDSICSRESCTGSVAQLEMPPPERLLPVGPREDVAVLADRLRRSLTSDCCHNVSPNEEEGKTAETPHASSYSSSKQDSLELSRVSESSATSQRAPSPRRLIKQVALAESPPDGPEEVTHGFYRGAHCDKKAFSFSTAARDRLDDLSRKRNEKLTSKRRKKVGLFSMGNVLRTHIPKRPGSWCGSQQPLLDPATQQACHAAFDLRQSSFRIGDDCVLQRCPECGVPREEYNDEELGLCIVILCTFIHREPGLAAPMLPEILSTVAKLALKAGYPWQTDGNTHLPGGAVSVAHQFMRCILHQLAPNGVFFQMFQTQIEDSARSEFFRSVAQALLDFNELNPCAPLQLLLETVNAKKSIAPETVVVICKNMATYLEQLSLDIGLVPAGSPWLALLSQMDLFYRRVALLMPIIDDILAPVALMPYVFKLPGISTCKCILESLSKVLSYAVQNTVVDAGAILELCQLCNRSYVKDREKQVLTRMLIFELVQALKFKTTMPDANFVMLINFVIQDTGNCLVQSGVTSFAPDSIASGTNAAEIMKQHLADAFEFLADFHTVSKIKSFCQRDTIGLNEDTLGGALKSGVAQYVALEMSRGTRDNRAVARHLPWLYNAPSSLQQGPREFLECMGHVRLLSWLLLGGLFQSLSTHAPCTPVPPEASCHVADHIQVILAGFAEQSKASVLHMSSLFHAFILCQLWTVYLEAGANSSPPGSEPQLAHNSILLDFWGKVTPCILQLVAHSKVLAEMVNLHFLSLLEALLEVNAAILGKLLPLWTPVLFAHHIQLPGHLQVRLQNCRNYTHGLPTCSILLAKWLQRLQFKMGQIELQSSAATQFYSV